MEINRRAFIASLGGTGAVALMSPDEKADALEHYMEARLVESGVVEGLLSETQDRPIPTVADLAARNADLTRDYRNGVGALFVNRNDGDRKVDGKLRKLQTMPDQPTLLDFFRYRFSWTNHCLQSATRALKTGMPEEIVLASLLRDDLPPRCRSSRSSISWDVTSNSPRKGSGGTTAPRRTCGARWSILTVGCRRARSAVCKGFYDDRS